jgi:ubiquinone biosynthesis protein
MRSPLGAQQEQNNHGWIERVNVAAVLPVRVIEIAWVVIIHAISFSLIWPLRRIESKSSAHAITSERLRALLQALGPTYIKLGQILSSRPDLVTPAIAASLSLLQEQVSARPPRNVHQLLEQRLGRELHSIFAGIDTKPIATGSVAHVYRAELLDGTKVAVKIIRQGVQWRINCDMMLFTILAASLQWMPPLKLIPLTTMVREIRQVLVCQLNLTAEANSNIRFSENFASDAHVVLPRIYTEFSNDYVLTMEFLDDLQRVELISSDEQSADKLAKVCVRALFQMIFVDGFVHGDLHPGNVRFRNNKDLVLLDFGLMIPLDSCKRAEFTRFFLAIATNDGSECAKIAFATSSWRSNRFDWQRFEQAMCGLVSEHSRKTAEQFEVTRFAADLFDLFRRNGLRGTTDFITVILALVVFEGIVKKLSPMLDFQAEARHFISNAGKL